jgi:hypothetical protein
MIRDPAWSTATPEPTASPTLTIVALAIRLADHLKRTVGHVRPDSTEGTVSESRSVAGHEEEIGRL